MKGKTDRSTLDQPLCNRWFVSTVPVQKRIGPPVHTLSMIGNIWKAASLIMSQRLCGVRAKALMPAAHQQEERLCVEGLYCVLGNIYFTGFITHPSRRQAQGGSHQS